MIRKTSNFFLILILILNTGCSINKDVADQVSDTDLLRFVYDKYKLAVIEPITFEEFSSLVTIWRDNHDVNNDGKSEIVFSVYFPFVNAVYIYVFSVEQDNSIKELFFNENAGWYSLVHQISYSKGYIVVDYLTKTGGTNVRTSDWKQEIIKCGKSKCASVEYIRYTFTFSFGLGGIDPVYSIEVGQAEILGEAIVIHTYNYQDISYRSANFCYDSSGGIWSGEKFGNKKIIGPTTVKKYIWDDKFFNLILDKIETPEYLVQNFPAETDSAFYRFLKLIFYEEETSDELILAEYQKFFGLEKEIQNPCSPINNYLYIAPKIIAGSFLRHGDKSLRAEIVGLKDTCKIKVWNNTDIHEVDSISEINVIGELNFPCIESYTQFFLEDINGDGLLEIFVLTQDPENKFTQTLRVFRVADNLTLIAEISGYLREPNFRGVEWKRQNEIFFVYAGRPFLQSGCSESEFSCYFLDKPFEIYIWDKNEQRLVKQER